MSEHAKGRNCFFCERRDSANVSCMPAFFSEAVDALFSLPHLALIYWGSLALMTRILIALAASGLGVYSGSRSEQSGLSTLLFFSAFGCFAYVIAVGMQLIE